MLVGELLRYRLRLLLPNLVGNNPEAINSNVTFSFPRVGKDSIFVLLDLPGIRLKTVAVFLAFDPCPVL